MPYAGQFLVATLNPSTDVGLNNCRHIVQKVKHRTIVFNRHPRKNLIWAPRSFKEFTIGPHRNRIFSGRKGRRS
jgi:hypothetical protein